MFRLRLAAVLALLAAGAMSASAQDSVREPPPGEGVICALAVYSAVAEAGSRCRTGQDAKFQSDLREMVASLDDYVLRNGDLTAAQLRQFKASPAGAGIPTERLCKGDAVKMYDAMKARDTREARSQLEKLLARPGKPTWGACL